MWTFLANDERATDRLGQALADHLPDGMTVALIGPLGAGKTRLCRAVAEACGASRGEVQSPTFVIVKEYHGRRAIMHLDLYRVRDEDELDELGFGELLAGPALKLIEWADRFPNALPPQRLEIQIEPTVNDARRFLLRSVGAELQPVVTRIREALD